MNDPSAIVALRGMLRVSSVSNEVLIRTVGRLNRIAEIAERLLDDATALQEQLNPESYEVSAGILMQLSRAIGELELGKNRQHTPDCGTKYRGCSPECRFHEGDEI